ncbi:MAG TPA: helix-turn-helix domain-containing protein [Candidatus Nitrosopolaris sp.]|nr:helix-turn-helix domain-containing protein [Candidatus Nitrosopolaris sp.]
MATTFQQVNGGVDSTREKRMRVSRERTKRNRHHILTAAARLFRENGIRATGVDSISREAGLTHGAFYSQFASKDALAAEAIGLALSRWRRVWHRAAKRGTGSQALRSIVANYLSARHRDSPGRGCGVAALGASVARQPRAVRAAFTRELKDAVDFLTELMPGRNRAQRHADAIAAFACMVGGLILARAVEDERFSARILRAAAKRTIHGGGREG